MSNFQCPQCGMVNIDCGKEGYKTPKELEYEKALEKIGKITASNFHDDNWVTLASKMDTISGIISNARKDNHVK